MPPPRGRRRWGTGALLAEVLRAHPHVRGTLVDLPRVVASALVDGVADRVTTAGQILRRCADATRPGGRVVVLSGVSPDEAGDSPPELLMLVLVGGKQRTLSQFRTLARQAGLDVAAAGRNAAGRYIVECRPQASPPTDVR